LFGSIPVSRPTPQQEKPKEVVTTPTVIIPKGGSLLQLDKQPEPQRQMEPQRQSEQVDKQPEPQRQMEPQRQSETPKPNPSDERINNMFDQNRLPKAQTVELDDFDALLRDLSNRSEVPDQPQNEVRKSETPNNNNPPPVKKEDSAFDNWLQDLATDQGETAPKSTDNTVPPTNDPLLNSKAPQNRNQLNSYGFKENEVAEIELSINLGGKIQKMKFDQNQLVEVSVEFAVKNHPKVPKSAFKQNGDYLFPIQLEVG